MNSLIRSACLFLLLLFFFTTPLLAQTKLYLNTGTSSTVSPAFNTGWTTPASANRYVMSAYKDNSTLSNAVAGNSGMAVRKCLGVQFLSDPLAAQTLTGSLTGQVRFQQSSITSTTGQGVIYLRVINPNGSIASEVGNYTTGNLTTTYSTYTLTIALGTLNITAGQMLCIELGWNYSVGTNTTRTCNISQGSSSGTDQSSGSAANAYNPWVQFPQTLAFLPPTNDDCTSAATLTSGLTCSSTTGNLRYATVGTPASTCGGTTPYDVWYKFVAAATTQIINVSNLGTGLTAATTYIETFNGSCAGASMGCQDATSKQIITGLTIGATYYVRVYTTSFSGSDTKSDWNFDICIMQPPVNDKCSNAKLISSDSTCVSGTSWLAGETLTNATDEGYTIASTCFSTTNTPDVWYKFVAKTKIPTISLSNSGSGWGGIGNVKIQLLSGTCGSLTEIQCASGSTLTPTLANSLTEGTTYYIRIHRNASGLVPANYTFDICVTDNDQVGSRMNEVFARTILSPANVLNYPWEVTYGPDNKLWVTEAQGYRMFRIDPTTGALDTVLNLSSTSKWLTSPSDSLYAQNMSSWSPWPQGGFAGMALHPNFLDGTGTTDFMYVTYVHRFLSGTSPSGLFYRNKLVRFTFNTSTNKFESPVVLCDTLPGSKDHNSQRLIIAPVVKGGTNYLFMGEGDMGSGQFENRDRVNKAQNMASYEGKILRFNLVSDGDAGAAAWIPNSNPYSSTSAVYAIGMRNNQGFAYDTALNILYGSSHGPYSDDEINIIKPFKNYGHPLVIGYADGNYNGTTTASTNTSLSAGANFSDNNGNSTCPPVGNEVTNMNTINANALVSGAYQHPLFSAYPTDNATMKTTWKNSPNVPNSQWYSEAWSGLDLYTNKMIPGWNKSLIASGLKWGRLLRLPLDPTGTLTLPSNRDSANVGDTITYFQSTNRYRDLAIAPNGKDIFVVMDNSSATSGPGVANPTTPACPGCLIKYSFLGYADDASGFSTISDSIWVTTASGSTCNPGTTVTIDGTNNYLWVPITGPDGNIMAEINAMGQNLGVVNSSFYKKAPANHSSRIVNSTRYLDRNITIVPTIKTFATPVKVRFYITKAEYDSLAIDPLSGVLAITNLKILKNADACSASIITPTTAVTPTNTLAADLTRSGGRGYVLQTTVSDFNINSSFYFAANNVVLPVDLITFTGTLQNDLTTLLNWKTENEINTARFEVERSVNGNNFSYIGNVAPKGNTSTSTNYSLTDIDAAYQQSSVLYYRLKIIDINGTIKYSNIIKITLPDTKGTITISPNPVSTELRSAIVATVSSNVTWQVIDSKGSTVLQGNAVFNKGNNKLSINTSQLSSGSYYLRITGSDKEIKASFQKL